MNWKVVCLITFLYKKKKKDSFNLKKQTKENFRNDQLKVNNKNYYFSNVIARASKTMLNCHNSKLNVKLTGTNG